MTNEKTRNEEEKQYGYIKSFRDRKTHTLIQQQERILFQWECFQKNLNEVSNISQLDDIYRDGDFYGNLKNFRLHTTEFENYCLRYIFLSPYSMYTLQNIIYQYSGIKVIPILHTEHYKHTCLIDGYDTHGHGVGALIQWGGTDRSQVNCISKSLLLYLEDHYNKLSQNFFFCGNGRVESFANGTSNPNYRQASIRKTNEIIVEASAKYIQHFSFYDQEYYGNTDQFFAYQIRIYVDPSFQGIFDKCQLLSRHWQIQSEGSSQPITDDEIGVNGKKPIFENNSQIFTYQGSSKQHSFGTVISGYFHFMYIEGDKKGTLFRVYMDPFELTPDEGFGLQPNPLFEPWMHQL
eukprot:403331622